MNISARNFRGLVKADLTVDRITLVAGGNYQAKTSLFQAIAAALTREPVKQFDLAKKDAAMLVHDGTENAHIEIATDEGSVELEWPGCVLKAFGKVPPQASPIALGMTAITPPMPARDRAAALEPYLRITPTREDLARALSEGYEPATIDRVWQQIQRDGWNAVHTRQVQEGQKTKGAWEQVTGEKFGTSKVTSWRPKNWQRRLEDITDEELEQRLTAAKKVYAETLQANAVNAAETERQRKLAASLPQLQQELEVRGIARDQAEIRYGNAVRARQKLLPLSREAGLECPHCGKHVVVQQDLAVITLRKFEPIPDAKLKAAREAIDAADRAMEHDQGLLNGARAAYTRAEQAVADALQAKTALETATPAANAPTPTISVETAASHIQNASDDLLMARQYTKADDLAAKWEDLQEFITLLAPTGLRQTKLVEALTAFNQEKLARWTTHADWKPVQIEEDLSITYGGRPYTLLSASEMFRVRVVLQLAMALDDGSELVLIDGADILDTAGRDELFALLDAYDEHGPLVIVAMTLFDPTRTPDLAEIGLGVTYWIEEGTVMPLADAAALEMIDQEPVFPVDDPVLEQKAMALHRENMIKNDPRLPPPPWSSLDETSKKMWRAAAREAA